MNLRESLIAACDALATLEVALAQEQTALQRRDFEALEQAVVAKVAPLNALHEIGQQWAQMALSTEHLAAANCEEAWAIFQEKAANLRQVNAINGVALQARRQATHRALSCLRGVDATPVGYGPTLSVPR